MTLKKRGGAVIYLLTKTDVAVSITHDIWWWRKYYWQQGGAGRSIHKRK